MRLPAPLVSTAWLAQHLGEVVVVDASYYLSDAGRDPAAEYAREHIPGAVFWDLDALSDPDTDLPHMMPAPEWLARVVGELGISDRDVVVVYDTSGIHYSAPRVWWMLRALGHEAVAVLDGGLGKWRSEGRAVESGIVRRQPAHYQPTPRSAAFRSLQEVRAVLPGGVQVLDARSRGRFEGTEAEPRPGVRGGHIPGSRNLPYPNLVGPGGTLKPPEELERLFRDAGIDLKEPVIATCGSGVTACALILGLEVLGHRDHAVYDGSWSEWGGRTDTPVATSPES
jgi:thiosulfate/3-mercaptopyruvate sulfurtransferase